MTYFVEEMFVIELQNFACKGSMEALPLCTRVSKCSVCVVVLCTDVCTHP